MSSHEKESEKAGDANVSTRIIEQWEELNSLPVDAAVIAKIQARLRNQIRLPGPANIARILADRGAELRHPEIIESDVAWRSARIAEAPEDFVKLHALLGGGVLDLKSAEQLIAELEILRVRFDREEEGDALTRLKEIAVQARQACISIAKISADKETRLVQQEISEWLKVWLETPSIFKEWLELRKRSDDFQRRFYA